MELFGMRVRVTAIGAVSLILLFFALGIKLACFWLTAIFLHELCHALMAKALSIRVDEIAFFPLGCVAVMPDMERADGVGEMLIALSGPLCSVLLSCVFTTLSQVLPQYYYTFMPLAQVNLAMGVFNLLPALPLDGGRIVRGLLGGFLPYRKATRLTGLVSALCGLMLIGIGILFVSHGQIKPAWFAIGILILLSCRTEGERSRYTVYHAAAARLNRPIPVRQIALREGADLTRAYGRFSHGKYHLISVVGADGRILRTLTQDELLTRLTGSLAKKD